MPQLTLEFEVYCARCGAGLCQNCSEEVSRSGIDAVKIEPCERCLEDAKNEGIEQGREEAEKDAT